jgi:hypothetical protein
MVTLRLDFIWCIDQSRAVIDHMRAHCRALQDALSTQTATQTTTTTAATTMTTIAPRLTSISFAEMSANDLKYKK